MTKQELLKQLSKLLKWGKVAAKFTALTTTLTGAITALTSSSVTMGLTIGATGATSYAAAQTISHHGYEKVTHVSPRAARAAALPPMRAAQPPMMKPATPMRSVAYRAAPITLKRA